MVEGGVSENLIKTRSSDEETENADSVDSESATQEDSVDELTALNQELEDMKDKFARSMADLDNYKKRIERDREQQNLKSKGLAVSSFLEVVEIIRCLIKKGSINRIVVKNNKGKIVLNIPINVALVGALMAPVLVGASFAFSIIQEYTIEIDYKKK